MGFGWMEILVILGIVLLLFGPKKLPELARSLGSSVNIFKEELSTVTESFDQEVEDVKPESLQEGFSVEIPEDSSQTKTSSQTTQSSSSESEA